MRAQLLRHIDRYRDAILLLTPLLVMLALAMAFDAFEAIAEFSEAHERWQLDELFVALVGAALLYLILLISRTRRLRTELVRRIAAEADAERVVKFDSLTGLASRTALIEAIDTHRTFNRGVSVLVVDLDRFKPINDTWGHQAGDAALRVVARRLVALVGDHGIVGRISGDEFGCVLGHQPGAPAATDLAEAMLKTIARPIQLPTGMAEIGASIGIVDCAQHGHSGETILGAADFAMYRAKAAGRSQYALFAPEMQAAMRERAELEIDMRSGIHRGEFIPYFQPIVSLQSGELAGFECLARWQHPTRGLLAPDVFIPIAEEAGLIQELGIGLLRNACIAARSWPQAVTLSINISPLQLNDPELPERLLRVLCTTGFAPGRLIVEVTESRLVGDIDSARTILESLKNAGVQIALDDFGTGYASLKHLRELHFNRIKIDRSFVQRLEEAENSEIVRAIMRMCRGLQLPVVAEGIESAETATRLAALGCDYGQGYHYSRPVAPEAALEIARLGSYPKPRVAGLALSNATHKPRLRVTGTTRATR